MEADDKTGFAFLPSAWFNLEYWRGHTDHGYYEVRVPMIGSEPAIADVRSWPDGAGRHFRVVTGGTTPPRRINVNGVIAEFRHGAWWAHRGTDASSFVRVVAQWPDGTVQMEMAPFEPLLPAPIIHPAATANGLRIRWLSRAGYLYFLECSNDLREWQPADNGTPVFGTGDWREITCPLPDKQSAHFARLRVMRVND